MSRLQAVALTQTQANAFVAKYHRHHRPVRFDKYRLGVAYDGRLVGVVQVNRPVARELDDGHTLEIVRLCTDGTENACSFLYSRAAKIAELLGYEKIITYTHEDENGSSLLASGFTLDGITRGGEWTCPTRPRRAVDDPCRKKRWVRVLREHSEIQVVEDEHNDEPQIKILSFLGA